MLGVGKLEISYGWWGTQVPSIACVTLELVAWTYSDRGISLYTQDPAPSHSARTDAMNHISTISNTPLSSCIRLTCL